MRYAQRRHLPAVLQQVTQHGARMLKMARHAIPGSAEARTAVVPTVPPEMNNRDYVAYLLTIDAQIEHALMVQYLYAAWSLGGPQVPEDQRELVAGWQRTILGIAKEEMGHLVSVQNVLRLIGAPLCLEREDYPWDTPFYPFPFMLEPATLDALAKYVFAESPPLDEWRGPLQDDVLRRVHAQVDEPKRVGALFDLLISLVKDPVFLPDDTFQAGTYPFQASFAEWGRGYDGSQVPAPGANLRPDVLVSPAATRDDAVAALQQIAQQGEATSSETRTGSEGPSHFQRFVEVYQGVQAAVAKGWKPWTEVARNPYVPLELSDHGPAPASAESKEQAPDAITDPESQLWAHLFNVRYRLLLQLLQHTFELADGLTLAGMKNPRGAIIHATFGEMYNMRAIGHVLVQSPLTKGHSERRAGAPFLVPYTFQLPQEEGDRWRRHRDLLEASARLVRQLRPATSPQRQGYLRALVEADQDFLSTINRVLAARASAR